MAIDVDASDVTLSSTPPRPHRARRRLRHVLRAVLGPFTPSRVIVVLLLTGGTAVLCYPAAGNWFSAKQHAVQVSGYVEQTAKLPPAQAAQLLEQARDHNANLPNGPLRDPYALGADGRPAPIGQGKQAYEQALNGPDGVMARLLIPKISVDLPVYHDTGAKSLDAGVGHLYGSGLPVGGKNTHSVLSAHSGVVGATLFSNLHKLQLGDTFQIQVLGEVLTYRVDQMTTVLPNELDGLRQIPGGDYVTLVTCTPIGVNTHRLLVRGVRVPTPDNAKLSNGGLGAVPGPGFPWWALPVPLVAAGGIAVTRPRPQTSQGPRAVADDDGCPRIRATERAAGSESFLVWQTPGAGARPRSSGSGIRPICLVRRTAGRSPRLHLVAR